MIDIYDMWSWRCYWCKGLGTTVCKTHGCHERRCTDCLRCNGRGLPAFPLGELHFPEELTQDGY